MLEHALKEGDKVCDALSKWEQLAREYAVGKVGHDLVPRFTFKRRLFLKEHCEPGSRENKTERKKWSKKA